MKFIIDDSDVKKIREVCEIYSVDGVTTNPSILAKSGVPPYELLKEIRSIIGQESELHVQVISKDAEGMIKEAERMRSVLGDNTYIKIPVMPQGLKAMKILKSEGANVTATAIYMPMQAYLAAKAGADYAAPYINRIDNLGADGVQAAKDMHDIFKNNGFKTEVLAASFKNSQQVLELCKYGIGGATMGIPIIEGLIKNPTVEAAVDAFIEDFENLTGKGKTMFDC